MRRRARNCVEIRAALMDAWSRTYGVALQVWNRREIQDREAKIRDKLRYCGCSLPGNKEHKRGGK